MQQPPTGLIGYVDLYGYHSVIGGWFFGGWILHSEELDDRSHQAVAHFSTGSVTDHVSSLFFSRNDAGEGAVGFLVFLRAATPIESPFRCLTVDIDGVKRDIYPATPVQNPSAAKLLQQLRFMISLARESEQRRNMLALLDGPPDQVGHGYVEFFGYHTMAGGWLISGWVSRPWTPGDAPGDILISFENGDVAGKIIGTFFPRQELPDGAQGLLLFVAAPQTFLGPLHSISMIASGVRTTLRPADAAPQLREPELVARMKSNLVLAPPDLARDQFFNLMTRRPYTGEDTLDALSRTCRFTLMRRSGAARTAWRWSAGYSPSREKSANCESAPARAAPCSICPPRSKSIVRMCCRNLSNMALTIRPAGLWLICRTLWSQRANFTSKSKPTGARSLTATSAAPAARACPRSNNCSAWWMFVSVRCVRPSTMFLGRRAGAEHRPPCHAAGRAGGRIRRHAKNPVFSVIVPLYGRM